MRLKTNNYLNLKHEMFLEPCWNTNPSYYTLVPSVLLKHKFATMRHVNEGNIYMTESFDNHLSKQYILHSGWSRALTNLAWI